MSDAGRAPATRRLIQAYPSPLLRRRLTAFVQATGMSNAEVTLEAIQTVHDLLLTVWAPVAKPASQLFSRSAYRRLTAVETHQTGIRLSVDDVATIDDLVAEANAPSRSAYLCAAWDLYLPHLSATEDDVLDAETGHDSIPGRAHSPSP